MADNQPPSKKGKTIFSFFKKRESGETMTENTPPASSKDTATPDLCHPSIPQVVEPIPFSSFTIERVPGLRTSICDIESPAQRDKIRRAYINFGPYQPKLSEYRKTLFGKQYRRFQYAWFKQFPWLEYSPSNHKAYCFPCFLFEDKNNPAIRSSLTTDGFDSWKRVNDGAKCAFLLHIGGISSPHSKSIECLLNLKNSAQHIDKIINAQSVEDVMKNRMRLMASIRAVRFLALQAVGFRGHDEGPESLNRGNFVELLKFKAEGNDDLSSIILNNAPGNAMYTSHFIQKEILNILANRVRKMICDEIRGGKFCILVDESQDESKRKQMALVLRYIKKDGLIAERFFNIVGVENTSSPNLKKEISNMLIRHNLPIENLRGQGYDGASNMPGQWNGLQALFLKDCPYAYYVHCFAHQLQLALVAAEKEESSVWQFFSHLTCIVNLVASSPKCLSELKSAQKNDIERMLVSGERQSGKGANQIGTLHQSGATRWSSHYDSVRDLMDMYDATCTVVESLKKSGASPQIRGQARGVFKAMKDFEFIFIMFLMYKIMGITDMLCPALQRKAQDILNAMKLVSTTKDLLQKLRQGGWETFLESVTSFCIKHMIHIPDLSCRFDEGTGRQCQQKDHITLEHYYHYDVFNATIDFQLAELEQRFSGGVVELLTLSAALDPSDCFSSFNVEDICKIAEKFYPEDFDGQDIHRLRCQLMHYHLDVGGDPDFQNVSTLGELCRQLYLKIKIDDYYLVDRLIRLLLTLPVSTATTERAFSGMKHVKTSVRNSMGDEFLADCLSLFLERDLTLSIDLDSMIDEFESLKTRRVKFR